MSCWRSDEDDEPFNPRQQLILPFDGNISIHPRPGCVWLGPKSSIQESAEASVEAAAMASATLAANTSSKHQNAAERRDSLISSSSTLVKEGNSVALFGNLEHKQAAPVIIITYKASEKAAFTFRFKATNRGQVQNESLTAKDIATAVKIKTNVRTITTQMKKLRRIAHENITEFVVAAVPIPPDASLSVKPPKRKLEFNADKFNIIIKACDRGCLEDALCCTRFPIPKVIKLSLCRDLLMAVQFLHRRRPYGKLSPRTCYVTEDWRLRVYPGNFEQVAERVLETAAFDSYGLHAARLFAAPEDVALYPRNYKTKAGDVYSVGLIMNMIFNDGAKPFAEHSNLDDVIKKLPSDRGEVFRPVLSTHLDPALVKLIKKCWSFDPDNRPSVSDCLDAIQSRLAPFFRGKHNGTELVLSKAYSREINLYMLQLESAQSHLSINLGEAVTKRLAESETRLQSVKDEYQRQIDILTRQLNAEQENAVHSLLSTKKEVEKKVEGSHLELEYLQSKVHSLQRDFVAGRLSLLPQGISNSLFNHAVSYFAMTGVSPDFDVMHKPVIFNSVTVMVVSIAGFSRYVQQLSGFPKTLMEILKCYYKAIDGAIESGNSDHSTTVHITERVIDACVLVAGVPDAYDRDILDVLDVAVKLVQWASRWDATKYLSSTSARLMLKIGIHSGPAIGGIIGKVPKLVLMGETVNIASMIETLSGPQEIRITANARSLLAKTGRDSNYLFDIKDDLDLKQRGKMGVFGVVVNRGEKLPE
ncbi:Nitrogen permease regulator 2 [Chytriomyces hyalinus]|nr:Nitrogen permease regulator 2 [Chytriomyces hyalinus]